MNKKPTTTKTTRTTRTSSTRAKKVTTEDESFTKGPTVLLSQIKIDIKHKNETQKKLTNSIKTNDVTFCTGPAGTGKTLLSVAEALLLLKNNPEIYREIKLVKSIEQLKGEDLGTLPGDEKDKLKFIMMSYFDAFYKLIGEELTNKLMEAGYIKMEVFGSIRGRSFSNCIIIIDEYQNVRHKNSKTFLTRFSENTKVVALGDTGQIDLKDESDSALEALIEDVKNNPEEGVGIVEFNADEVVRHRLTSYFIKLYDNRKKRLLDEKSRQTQIVKPELPKSQIIKEKSIFGEVLSFFTKK
jgi:phosphate starvation-inducible PhoH-like protein